MRLALYEPDIPQNTGTLLRLAACLGTPVDVIEPCGFVFSDQRLRRAGLDYLDRLDPTRHVSWDAYLAARKRADAPGRLVLLTTRAATPYTRFAYRPGDTLLLGRESAGVPDTVHAAADESVCIPMVPGLRSLNVAPARQPVLRSPSSPWLRRAEGGSATARDGAVAGAMVPGEALRQTGQLPRRSR